MLLQIDWGLKTCDVCQYLHDFAKCLQKTIKLLFIKINVLTFVAINLIVITSLPECVPGKENTKQN